MGGQAKTSTGLYPSIPGRATREASTTTETMAPLKGHVWMPPSMQEVS
jgi:hypothetical protein